MVWGRLATKGRTERKVGWLLFYGSHAQWSVTDRREKSQTTRVRQYVLGAIYWPICEEMSSGVAYLVQ